MGIESSTLLDRGKMIGLVRLGIANRCFDVRDDPFSRRIIERNIRRSELPRLAFEELVALAQDHDWNAGGLRADSEVQPVICTELQLCDEDARSHLQVKPRGGERTHAHYGVTFRGEPSAETASACAVLSDDENVMMPVHAV